MLETQGEIFSSKKTLRFSEKLPTWCLLVILGVSPIAFGSVHTIVYQTIQVLVFLTFLLYGLGQYQGAPGWISSFGRRHPFLFPIILWVTLIVGQMIPLAPGVLERISREAYQLYAAALGADYMGFRSLSLSSFDTWRSFVQVLTCGILFFLTVSCMPKDSEQRKGLWNALTKGPTDDPIFNCLLFVAFLAVAFEVFYGLGGYLAGGQHIHFFRRAVSADSATGTFINRDHYANYLLLFFPLLLSWSVLLFTKPKTGENTVRSFPGQQAFLTIVLIGVVVAVVASHSRMAIASAIFATMLMGVSFIFFKLPKKGIAFLVVLFVLAVVFLLFLDPGFSSFQIRLTSLLSGKDTGRFRVWRDSFAIVRDFPWFGTGLETFYLIFPKYSSIPITRRFVHAHSDWMELLVETGFIGFFFITVAALWFLFFYIKRLHLLEPGAHLLGIGILVSLIAFIVHSIAEFNFRIPSNAYSFMILAGMAVRLVEMKGREPS